MKTLSLPRVTIIFFSLLILCQSCLLNESNKNIDRGFRTVAGLEKNRICGVSNRCIALSLVGEERDFEVWCGSRLTNKLETCAIPSGATSAVVSVSTKLSPAPRETFVFIHGRPSSRFTFFGVLRYLTNTPASYWLLDLPGHGFSRTMPFADQGLVTPQNAARQVLRFVRKNRIEHVVLVGHSYGGLVACYATALAPNRVSGLVLIDSEGVARKRDEFLEGDKVEVQYGGCHWFAGAFGWVLDWQCFLKPEFCTRLFFPWREQANEALRTLTSLTEPSDRKLLRERQKEIAALIAIRENYASELSLTERVLPYSPDCYKAAAQQDEKVVRAVGQHFRTTHKKCVLIWSTADPLFPYQRHGADVFAKEFCEPLHTFDSGHLPHEVYPQEVADLIKKGFLP